jgi:sarcosine oxidase subunit gamma
MTIDLAVRSPFHGLLKSVGLGRGLVVSDRSGTPIVSIQARRNQARSVETGLAARSNALRLGPETWWLVDAGEEDLAPLSDVASIADQSDAYGVVRITGPRCRDGLAKLVFIDLHPAIFGPGDVASTVAAHIGITLWRLGDGPDGAVFEIACYRSFAADLWHALSCSAAEFGLQITDIAST